MTSQPNVLIITTDQQAHDAMSCAGNGDLSTPAMDSLAETGVRFRNTYCTYPLCTPSRASMFTGRMPHEVGVNGNNEGIDPRFRPQEMGWLFRRAGYDCVYGGKWHVPEIAIPDQEHGFRQICGFDDNHLADACIDYLNAPHDQPFLMVASFDNPHNICEWARQQVLPWGSVPDAPTEECPNLPTNYAIPAFEPLVIRLEQQGNPSAYSILRYTDDQWRHYRQAYFRLVEKVDAEIGRILDALRANGLEENTLVVFISDHGDGNGSHHWNQKSILYEEEVRVPMIVSLPGVTRAGGVDDHLVSMGLDLLPTVCDYAGIELPEGLAGLSLRDLAEGREPATWREAVYAETMISVGKKLAARMVRTSRYKYAVYEWGQYREQLMDLERDPGEMVNLAVESRYADVLQAHRRLLWEWCHATGDTFGHHYSHPGQVSVPGYEWEG